MAVTIVDILVDVQFSLWDTLSAHGPVVGREPDSRSEWDTHTCDRTTVVNHQMPEDGVGVRDARCEDDATCCVGVTCLLLLTDAHAAPHGADQSEGVHDAPRAGDEAQTQHGGEAAAQEPSGKYLLSLNCILHPKYRSPAVRGVKYVNVVNRVEEKARVRVSDN